MGFKDRFKDIKPVIRPVEKTIEQVLIPELEDIKKKLCDKISNIPVWFEYSDVEKNELIAAFVDNSLKNSDVQLSDNEKSEFISELEASVYGFGELDILLSDKNITSLTIKDCSPIVIDCKGEKRETKLIIENISSLKDKLLKLSGAENCKHVIKFAFKNLFITMVLPPVSEVYIYIKKKNRQITDFEYLLQNNKIDHKIYEFLISLINDKKNILISGKSDCGKTSYTEAFLNAMSDFTLLQENCFLEHKSFICGNLDEDEFLNLMDIVNTCASEYVIFDLNNGYYDTDNHSVITTLRADTVLYAITQLSGNEAAKRKLTEKQAKAKIAANFDYIIQLDDEMFISSISEFSLNKSGSLVITEILKRNENEYSYDF